MALSDHQYQIPPQYRAPEVSNEYVNQEIIRMEADIQAERDHQIEQEMINRRFADIMRQEYTVSPEIDPRYQNAKAIESKIEQLREMADHTTIPRYGLSALLYKAKTPFMPQDSDTLERQLLDVEAHIGGEIADAMFERNGGV